MTLLSPWFLLGALGVGLPLWLHLLQRENPVRLPFASLMFFEKRTQSTLLQRQFRYLLLLAARLALIALLVFAFAKPIWERPPTTVLSDIPSLHLIVLDTSMSMRFGDRWNRAVESAREIVNGMDAQDQGQILSTGPSVSVVTNPTREKAELLAALEALKPTSSRNSYGDVVEAVRSLIPNPDTPVEVHLISDFQNAAMPGRFSDVALPTVAQLDPVDVGSPDDENWAIESVKGSLRLVGQEKPRLEVTVAGFAPEPAQKTVSLEINGQTIASKSQEVPAMGRASFLFEDFDAPAGFSRAKLTLSPSDDLADDDVRLVALDNSDPDPILFVTNDRRRRDALYYESALNASKAAVFKVKTSSPGEAERLDPDDYALVTLSDVAQLSAGYEQTLMDYVRSGGSVLITVGPETAARGPCR
ncbi:MAG: VWA domain-containing protein [Bryobacterales bacterium]